ncbi:ATP-binding protein [Klenkia brasiliensis]|uniref:Anti-sigma regulatory factor (Ser/Thr protein kinase) n=1 Tax=Klenkia brasiliensis TaxID=333142 RepID=A0A1G7UCU0_9ACTN|nr:ATP-binding protein [Klenkia brasiliensis]SDG45287.1 Anti-sigma regulatory factor (Ser/Thr protein kinase) [Klenkia brasiliensis]
MSEPTDVVGSTAAVPPGYVHVAQLGTPGPGSAELLAPRLQQGLADGGTVVLACAPGLRGPLLDRLGADGVHVVDPDELGGRAPDAIAGHTALVDRLTVGGTRLHLVTDSGRTSLGVPAWLQTEALLNHVLDGRAVAHYCVIDPGDLGPETDRALSCHPWSLTADGVVPNPGQKDPAEVLRSLWSAPGPDPLEATPPTLEVEDVGSVRQLRRELTTSLADGPLDPDEAEDLVLAIDEVVANAAEHGVPPVDVRLWVTEQRVLCAVADRGHGFDEPLAGYGPAHGEDLSVGGMGLWLARRAVDRMTTAPLADGDGCVVRLVIDPRRED